MKVPKKRIAWRIYCILKLQSYCTLDLQNTWDYLKSASKKFGEIKKSSKKNMTGFSLVTPNSCNSTSLLKRVSPNQTWRFDAESPSSKSTKSGKLQGARGKLRLGRWGNEDLFAISWLFVACWWEIKKVMSWRKKMNTRLLLEKLPNIVCFAISSSFWVDFVPLKKKGLGDCFRKNWPSDFRGLLSCLIAIVNQKWNHVRSWLPSPIPF